MNPIITSIFTADPSAHVWGDGKIYIYPSHDQDPARGCDLMDKYHVFSSEDMVNWTDEGEILSSDDVSWGRPEGGFMWAPDCAYKNGTYYFYYPHPSGSDWNNTWKIGVAVSKSPVKDFKDIGYIKDLGGFAMIDPCVFVDDDGKAYMYYGGGAKCHGGELNDDMISLKGEMKNMDGIEDFHEAAWVFKRNGTYYLTYADNNHGKNEMRYGISKSPLGPWEYKGIFLTPTGCDTTHGSIAEYKGQWYLFYHNQSISNRGNLRSVCVDYLYFNDDGTIKTVVQTKDGVKSTGNSPAVNPKQTIYALNEPDGIIKENVSCEFDVEAENDTRAEIIINYTSANILSKLRVFVNNQDYSLINALSSENYPDGKGVSKITVKLQKGKNTVKLQGVSGEINIISLIVNPLD